MTNQDDPWDEATSEQPQGEFHIFGQIQVDCLHVALVKGAGKVAWDETTHKAAGLKRNTEIDLFISPLPEQNIHYSVEQRALNWEREWAGTTLPSLKACGVTDLRTLTGQWCEAVREPTGETYTSKRDGKTKEKRALKILRLLPDEAACRAAFEAWKAGTEYVAPAPSGNGSQPTLPTLDPQQEAAAKFLPVIVATAIKGKTDPVAMRDAAAAAIATYPLVSKFYTIDSPEVVDLLLKATTV